MSRLAFSEKAITKMQSIILSAIIVIAVVAAGSYYYYSTTLPCMHDYFEGSSITVLVGAEHVPGLTEVLSEAE